jgi:hypothetical protein
MSPAENYHISVLIISNYPPTLRYSHFFKETSLESLGSISFLRNVRYNQA